MSKYYMRTRNNHNSELDKLFEITDEKMQYWLIQSEWFPEYPQARVVSLPDSSMSVVLHNRSSVTEDKICFIVDEIFMKLSIDEVTHLSEYFDARFVDCTDDKDSILSEIFENKNDRFLITANIGF